MRWYGLFLNNKNGDEGTIRVGKFKQYDYFGHESALTPGANSTFTIVAGFKLSTSDKKQNLRPTDIKEKCYVECLQFRLSDMTDLKTFLSLSSLFSLTQEDIKEIKNAEIEKNLWKFTKKSVMDGFARENTGDPSMSAAGLKIAKRMKRTREINWK
jgi:hypothetical protein